MSSVTGRPTTSPSASAATWTPATATTTPASPHEFTHTHPDINRDPVRYAEQAIDQLNPNYGVPADQRSRYGRQAVRDREAALTLGIRVAVHDSRQNDRNPVIWLGGQDYRMADSVQAARSRVTRTRWGPERVGPER
jgi:hypothetical protein